MVAFRVVLKPGDMVDGRYCIERTIGSGSYGTVYKAIDERHRAVAIKLQRLWEIPGEQHGRVLARFDHEYSTSRIASKYLVHALGHGCVQGNPYIVMEYCPGGDLSALIGKPNERLPFIVNDILLGLHALHSEGKVHRDLKPENVLLKGDGHAALTDFGTIGDRNHRFSARGFFSRRPKQVFGTYIYMAPEQANRKGGGVTYLPTVDIFSLGVMIYELLTGAYPFGSLTNMDELNQYQDNAFHGRWSLEALVGTSNAGWLPIIERCIMPDYRDRYQSATDMLHELWRMSGHRPLKPRRPDSHNRQIQRLVISQGENAGLFFNLKDKLINGARMIRIGREKDNDIVVKELSETFASRYHCTMIYYPQSDSWLIRDGQWRPADRCWKPSTNGTYVNSTPVTGKGVELYGGDIITLGEIKMKVN